MAQIRRGALSLSSYAHLCEVLSFVVHDVQDQWISIIEMFWYSQAYVLSGIDIWTPC